MNYGRACPRSHKIANLPERLVAYREVPGSVTRTVNFKDNLARISADNIARAAGLPAHDRHAHNIAALYHRVPELLRGMAGFCPHEPDFARCRQPYRRRCSCPARAKADKVAAETGSDDGAGYAAEFGGDKIMITVRLVGGLGNQMFQYACGQRLAHDRGVALRLDTADCVAENRPYALDHFRIEARVLGAAEGRHVRPAFLRVRKRFPWLASVLPGGAGYVGEKHFSFDPAILESPSSCYLDGYWQSERYLRPYPPPSAPSSRSRNR